MSDVEPEQAQAPAVSGLTERQALRMRHEILAAGLDFRDVYQRVGIEVETQTTPEQYAQVRLLIREAREAVPKTLGDALLAVQRDLPKLEKAAINPHFKSKYISLDTIMAEVLPIVNRHGLVWITQPSFEGDELVLRYGVLHPGSGDEMFATMKLLAAKDDPQGQGAAITYARRYSITSFFGISADEDDDGNRATQARQASRQRQTEARQAARLLSEDQLAAMTAAIREKGLDVAETLQEAGIEEPLRVTATQAQAIREIIDAAVPES